MNKTIEEIQVFIVGFDTKSMLPFARIEKIPISFTSGENVELNMILECSGIEIIDYSKEIAIILDDQGMVKEGNPIFEIVAPDNAIIHLAGTLIFAKNIYNTESVDLDSLKFEEIQYLVQNLDIKVEGMVKKSYRGMQPG